jgi:hypothetical protein
MKKLFKSRVFLGVCAAIATIIIGYIINQLPALKDLLQAKNTQELMAILSKDGNGIAIAICLLLGLFTIWLAYHQVVGEPENSPANIDPTIRPRLLEAEATKVKQRLQDSLHNLLMLDLQREEQPQQVGRNPIQPLYTVATTNNHTTSQPQVLDRVVNVLRRGDISGRLLILGQPGGGKTTTLLDLAEELNDLAKLDATQSIPMIFELSAWQDDSVGILDWMLDQLKREYNLQPGISRVWLERGEILPLLDGLDELGLEKQRKCIRAINEYLAADKTRDLVVCCREEEYKVGEEQLSELHGAICLQELSDGQIRDYLHQLNRGDLWQSVQNNPEFLELARTPLLLSMMVVAYQGRSIQTKQELFDAYIDRRFGLVPVGKGEFSRPQIIGFLVFLAKRLQGTQTEFLIENMQPSWLQNRQQRLICQLIFGLISMLAGLIIGFPIGCFYGAMLIIDAFTNDKDSYIILIEPIHLSLKRLGMKAIILDMVVGGLFCGSIFGVFIILPISVTQPSLASLLTSSLVGLLSFLPISLIHTDKNIKNINTSNQGIWESLKNCVFVVFLAYFFCFCNSIWLIPFLANFIPMTNIKIILYIATTVSSTGAFFSGGGEACLQHFSLRLVLWYNRYIPWNYAKFLSRAADRRIIQQIGGRYRFIHRLLLEHFADM